MNDINQSKRKLCFGEIRPCIKKNSKRTNTAKHDLSNIYVTRLSNALTGW